MSTCDNCGKEAEVKQCVIKDEMGTRYRNLCIDCASQMCDESTETNSKQAKISDVSSKKIVTSNIYKIISIVIAICGFISGIAIADTYPIKEIQYEYPSVQIGDTTIIEKFNAPLMIYIWIGTAFAFLGFWAIYCILKNQESLLEKIKSLETK